MSKLTQRQKDFINLVLRSPDKGDGWRAVSKVLMPITLNQVSENPELFEVRDGHGGTFVRMSERGDIVRQYV